MVWSIFPEAWLIRSNWEMIAAPISSILVWAVEAAPCAPPLTLSSMWSAFWPMSSRRAAVAFPMSRNLEKAALNWSVNIKFSRISPIVPPTFSACRWFPLQPSHTWGSSHLLIMLLLHWGSGHDWQTYSMPVTCPRLPHLRVFCFFMLLRRRF